jgi:hypothetical protein
MTGPQFETVVDHLIALREQGRREGLLSVAARTDVQR